MGGYFGEVTLPISSCLHCVRWMTRLTPNLVTTNLVKLCRPRRKVYQRFGQIRLQPGHCVCVFGQIWPNQPLFATNLVMPIQSTFTKLVRPIWSCIWSTHPFGQIPIWSNSIPWNQADSVIGNYCRFGQEKADLVKKKLIWSRKSWFG